MPLKIGTSSLTDREFFPAGHRAQECRGRDREAVSALQQSTCNNSLSQDAELKKVEEEIEKLRQLSKKD